MKKNWFAFFSVVLFVAAIGLYYTFFVKSGELANIQTFEQCVAAGNAVMESYPSQCRTSDGRTFTENIGNEIQMTDKIKISSPRPNQYLVSPVMITGEARGTWFFEATAPVKLVDDAGKVIAQGYITAQGEWMTTEFVPFSGEIVFTAPANPKANLVLEKSNPSGLPEKAEQLSIPVYLK